MTRSPRARCDREQPSFSKIYPLFTMTPIRTGLALREAGRDPDNYVQRVKKLKVMCAASSSPSVGGAKRSPIDCKPVITPRMHRIFARQ
jgi:hypothetical protein